MAPNPYQPPNVASESAPETTDYSGLILRVVVGLQIIWIAFVGAMARGAIPEAFALVTPALPVIMLGCPILVVCLAYSLSRGMFLALVGVEIALSILHFVAILPAVQ